GNLYQRSLKLEDQVRPSLMNLLQETGESASLFIRQGEDRICLFRQDSDHAVRDHVSEGQILSLDRGAAGHVISKFDPDYNSEADIRPRVADLPVFSFGERVAEVAAAAVPVFWLHEGRVKLTGALTVSGPLSRFTDDACKIMRAALLKEGQQLSARLGAEYIWK
ncbi:MAG TPA: IclR family transcriptional regulator, partial [Rhodospirillaceae bacterium]|nr:IclR family transcriptional regulator [Rhodospirillaceae bacterium]